MRLPTFNRFSLEDFPDQKEWIDKLFSPLNDFMTQVTGALNLNITHKENILAQVGTIKVSTKASYTAGSGSNPQYAELQSPGQLKITMKVKPVGLVIWNVQEIATNPTTLHYGVTADWSYSNGELSIAAVSGLEPAKSYNLTVAVYGG